MIAAVRYSHMRDKLMALGAPASTAMDRILKKKGDDINVEKLKALLQLPNPKSDTIAGDTAAIEKDAMETCND